MNKYLLALLFLMSISGCADLFKPYNYREEYRDPKKSFIVLYIRYDADTYGDILYLKSKSGKTSEKIYHFRNESGIEKEGTCLVFGGLVNNDVYEIETIAGRDIAYKFESNAPYNIKINITKPDIYFIGQYDLGLARKSGFLSSGSFSFNKSNGCPGEKTAYKDILKTDTFKEMLEGTRWPERFRRKIENSK
jgi:hypothetical protein